MTFERDKTRFPVWRLQKWQQHPRAKGEKCTRAGAEEGTELQGGGV